MIPAHTLLDNLPFFTQWGKSGHPPLVPPHIKCVAKQVGSYSVQRRQYIIDRFKEKKKKNRHFHVRAPKYEVRHLIAKGRPRCVGRFLPLTEDERLIRTNLQNVKRQEKVQAKIQRKLQKSHEKLQSRIQRKLAKGSGQITGEKNGHRNMTMTT